MEDNIDKDLDRQSNEAAKPKSNNKILIVILILIVVLGLAGYASSRYFANKIGEKVAETMIEGATNADVDISNDGGSVRVEGENNSFEINSNSEWPNTMPSIVPKYDHGKITVSATSKDENSGESWTVSVEETNETKYREYTDSLAKLGWENFSSISSSVELNQYKKSGYILMLSYNPEEKGISLVVTKENETSYDSEN